MQVRVILAKAKELAGADRRADADVLPYPGVTAMPPAAELRCPHCNGRLILAEIVVDLDGEPEGPSAS